MTGDTTAADAGFMQRALALATRGWGRVHPNPLVGAVVARDGVVVGEGAHREYGGAHAEVEALAAAGDRARGATLYVTVEPCAHHGKTPPCTDAILAAGVRRVVYAVTDPHPAARGGGETLRAAGLEVVGGVEREAARRQNALFLLPLERGGRPFVALKYALSLDARLARAEGERTRVTGREAEAEVHRLRAGFDAILVGGRTARVDDPLLTARGEPAPRVAPVRVVASAGGDLPLDSALVATARETPVWLVTGDAAPQERLDTLVERGVRVLRVAGRDRDSGAGPLVRRLADEGVRTILCEGGGRLGAALLEAGAVDRLYLFHAPVLFGEAGVPAFPGVSHGHPGRVVGVTSLGNDTLTIIDRSD